ncbi:MAG: class I SAM-dependent methyltransferase [Gammaproteobacteria bacterium]|nr:class I SAM-dependent methyltransferase [Gammaproteobacteria bacterium]
MDKHRQPYRNYDAFARVYNTHWGPRYGDAAMPVLECLLGDRLKEGKNILDPCCGTGHVSQRLIEAGHAVVGIDGSGQLLELARDNAPTADFRCADARDFYLDTPQDIVICLNDSLNHVLSVTELAQVFRCVFEALAPGGCFLFDLNLEHKYLSWQWNHSFVEDDLVCVIHANADVSARAASFKAIVFERAADNAWSRQDVELDQTWYDLDEVTALLESAGFRNVECLTHEGKPVSLETGKAFFSALKPGSHD